MSAISEQVNSILESYRKEEEERKLLEQQRREEIQCTVNKIIEESKPYWEARVLFERETRIVKEHKIICPECPHEIRPEYGKYLCKNHDGKKVESYYNTVYDYREKKERGLVVSYRCEHVDEDNIPCCCESHGEILNARFNFIKDLKDQYKAEQAEKKRKQEAEEALQKHLEEQRKAEELKAQQKAVELERISKQNEDLKKRYKNSEYVSNFEDTTYETRYSNNFLVKHNKFPQWTHYCVYGHSIEPAKCGMSVSWANHFEEGKLPFMVKCPECKELNVIQYPRDLSGHISSMFTIVSCKNGHYHYDSQIDKHFKNNIPWDPKDPDGSKALAEKRRKEVEELEKKKKEIEHQLGLMRIA